jgi:hypothetical protein
MNSSKLPKTKTLTKIEWDLFYACVDRCIPELLALSARRSGMTTALESVESFVKEHHQALREDYYAEDEPDED